MKNEIKKILASMKVRDNRENAEQMAYDIYKLAPETLSVIMELGLEYKNKTKDEKTKNFLRATIFTLIIYYQKNRSAFIDSPYFNNVVDLLIELSKQGFSSARTALSNMGFSDYDIYRRQLLLLPEVEKHRHDKEISTHEAYEEIRLSKSFAGYKGFLKDHYALGVDNKHAYEIFRIGKKLFALRVHRSK